MCGIVGVCGKVTAKEESVFKTLLCLDTIRGPHSTGVLGVSGSGGYEIFKKVGTPWDCFGEEGFDKLFKYTNVLLLGHNRWATVGKVTDKNAHPFDVGDVIGVHNGTIRSEHKLDDHIYFDVDSETVLHNFAKNGVAPTVEILDGAFAIVFYDKRDHSLHMLRNSERPLTYAYSEDMKTLFWASEPWMLTIACGRYGIKIGDIMDLKVMEEMSFVLPKESSPSKVGEIPEATVKALKKKAYVAPVYHYKAPWRPAEPKNDPKTSPLTLVGSADTNYKKLQSFVGKDINFSVTGYVKNKPAFLRAYAELPEADVVEIRIFMDEKCKKFRNLLSLQDRVWNGHVKRLKTLDMSRGYLLLDNRTIKPTDPRAIASSIDRKSKSFNLAKGKIVTIDEWLLATSAGCDNCGDIPKISQAGDIVWCDDHLFFCKHCFNTQNVQQFVSLLGQEG